MNNKNNMNQKSNIIMYTTEDGLAKIEATFDEDTVWLSIDQMAELFQRDKSTISRHIKNVFSEGELVRESVVANFATTAADGKTYQVDYYNLDVIISVGYRVKSKRGTQFRIWATGILKEYMRKGFALDDERLKNLGGGGYFKELLEDVERAKVSQKLLKFTLHSRNISLNGEKNSILYMKPSCIQEDDERMYNYIVGMIASSQDGPWQIGSVRLTSIKTCTMQSHSGKIISKSEKEIREAIKQRGVQYLSAYSNTGKVVVQLTPEGEKMYRQILHLRPLYIKKEGSIYEFDCTIRQVDNYFFKFGHNAKVLEPQYLADLFMRRYQSAARQYE